MIKDLDQGWEITCAQDKLFPSASMAKVPIMVACFYAAKERRLDLKEKLPLKANQRVSGSGLLKYQACGTKWSVEELMRLMIAESDNSAANMLIDRLGFDYRKRSP